MKITYFLKKCLYYNIESGNIHERVVPITVLVDRECHIRYSIKC